MKAEDKVLQVLLFHLRMELVVTQTQRILFDQFLEFLLDP